ncbi:LOW QUALITY PROTEIN: hypothetical protein U9M48_023755 [Paspalum notatum var. saurae]|uniref:ATP-dependent DNA helicase n=1 Tax=Paspalum notatum var. saurae TaxID=547442 RepID=A0AAQ3TLE0_PASNO
MPTMHRISPSMGRQLCLEEILGKPSQLSKRLGNGTEEDDGDGCIHLPDEICVPYTGEDTNLHRLIEDVFPMLDDNMTDPDYITSRAIWSTRNDCVDRINMRMIHCEEMVYHSFNRADDDPHNYYPPEFLNSSTP